MKQLLPLIVLFILLPHIAFSQTVISGSVKNRSGDPLEATVTLQAKGSVTISGFASTDANGAYSVTYKGSADSVIVTISGINIGRYAKTAVNRSGTVDFVIDEKPIEIKETTVTAPKMSLRGDTLNYLVSSYIDQNDRTIGDVLRKLPGIEVSTSGAITYQNRAINKFYIENMDLLQGRYSLATKNITAKDVAAVQVLENHQPIKALKDRVHSDQAAINLKLKDSAKGTWTLSGLAGMGYKPVLWNAELVGMLFNKTRQNMSTYKGNNSGDDIIGEFRTHYDYERVNMSSGSSLSVQMPSTPPVPSKRYMNNRSHAAGINQLFKLGEDTELTANVLYYNDRIEKEGHSLYEQYLPGDSTLAIEERVTSVSKIHNAEAALRLKTNASDIYFNNALNVSANWNDDYGTSLTRSNAASTDETIMQHLNKPAFTVDNTLNILKNVKNNTYNLYFSAGYSRKHHDLTVSPVNYLGDENFSALTQHILSEDFSSVIRTTYLYRFRKLQLNYALWGRADLKNMDTQLSGKDQNGIQSAMADSMKNDLRYDTWQVGFNQEYKYETSKFLATIRVPFTHYRLSIADRIPDKTNKHNKIILHPSLSVRYNLTSELTLSAGTNYNRSFGDIHSAYTGYIMHSYRSLLRNSSDKLFETRSGGGNASLSYRNVFKALFIDGGVHYKRSWRSLLYGYNYQGIMSVKTVIDQPTRLDGFGINLNGSKGLDFWSATVRASGGYSTGTGELLIQDEKIKSRSEGYNTSGSITTNPTTFMGLVYSVAWAQNKSYTVDRSERFPAIQSVSQDVKFNLFPIKALTFNFSFEHQYNSATNPHYTYFADTGVKFKYKQWDLELAVNNLFNAKQYISASYNDVSMYSYSYDLRPTSVLVKARFKIK